LHITRNRKFESISLQRRVSNEPAEEVSPLGLLLPLSP
jgi:hypothetical protein